LKEIFPSEEVRYLEAWKIVTVVRERAILVGYRGTGSMEMRMAQ
jgi:hypothetical protein